MIGCGARTVFIVAQETRSWLSTGGYLVRYLHPHTRLKAMLGVGVGAGVWVCNVMKNFGILNAKSDIWGQRLSY